MVKAKQDQDAKITKLIQRMQSTYSIVLGAENLKKDAMLQGVLDRILQQTIVCGFSIQNYMNGQYCRERGWHLSHHRTGSIVRAAFSGVDDLMTRYQEKFDQLQEEFMGRIAIRTALIIKDTAAKVHDIGVSHSSTSILQVISDGNVI